jgi:NTE family protein
VCVLATNLLTGAIAEFSHAGIQEECLGAYAWPELPLAHAVAASCSVPPSFRPVTLRLDPQRWLGPCPPRYERTRRRPAALRLVDGGNYDNLALSRVWDRYSYVLASVGSSPMLPWTWVSGDWLTATLRSNRILIDEVRDLRLRELQERNRLHGGQHCVFWTIDDDPQRFAAPGSLACASNTASRLARMRTRLGRHTAAEQGQLINWGYAACDAALRKGLVPDAPPPAGWPVPEHALN